MGKKKDKGDLKRERESDSPFEDRMVADLAASSDLSASGPAAAWVGMEPTFQDRRSVELWREMAARPGGEDAYFRHDHMLGTAEKLAKRIKKRYDADRKSGGPACLFDDVDLDEELDQWGNRRFCLRFEFRDRSQPDFKVRITMDPETFEYSIKPVPLAWFELPEFVAFLEDYVWAPTRELGLVPTMAHGGCQFSLSARAWMGGSLLADDIASLLNHPELSTLMMDWPNPDDRAFRATTARFSAFRRVLAAYREGRFHPAVLGTLTAGNALLDRGWGPSAEARPDRMDPARGPLGDPGEVFRTNFAFARAVRHQAQLIDCGYWQSAHPKEVGYRPDQIMRYSEGNLNRLQIAGECHVKSDKVLDPERVPDFDRPLEPAMLYREASWENRGQMGRTSAADFVEALFLYVNHARWLEANPGVEVVASLHQDQLHGEAASTLVRHGGTARLDQLRREAVAANLEASGGRVRCDFVEPEVLFWEAWRALPSGERAEIAVEAVGGFVDYVGKAASRDPRPQARDRDPMEAHRHRVHPILWDALADAPRGFVLPVPVRRELDAFRADRKKYLERRPAYSTTDDRPPWEPG